MRLLRLTPTAFLLLLALGAGRPAAAEPIAIYGRAVDPAGAPLAGARVELLPYPDRYLTDLVRLGLAAPVRPAAVDRSDDRGVFRVQAPGDGMWQIEVRALGRLAMAYPLAGLVDETILPPVELAPDLGLAVTVVDEAGRPVAGAWVDGREAGGTRGKGWRPADRAGVTGDDGRLRLPRRAGEELTVLAWAPGTVVSAPARSADEPVVLRLRSGVRRTVEIRGADGEPRAGVVLRTTGGWPAGVSGEDGRLAVTAPAAGERVEAAPPQGWAVALDLPRAPVEAPETDPGAAGAPPTATLHLPAPAVVTGTVVDRTDGRPVAGAMVWVPWGLPAHARSDRAGRFRFLARPGGGDGPIVEAAAPGYLQGVRTASDDQPLLLSLAITLAGVVVDRAGLPIGDAVVRARRREPFPRSWRSEMSHSFDFTATADGRWLFRVAAGPGYELRATHPDFALTEAEVGPGESRRDLALVLRQGAGVIGRVVDPAGRPVADARVRLFAANSGGGRHDEWVDGERVGDYEAASDAEGRFAIRHLPPARFDLEARAAGFAPLELPGIPVAAEDGRDLDLGELTLEAGVAIEGWVTDADRRPVEGAHVALAPGATRPGPGPSGFSARGGPGPGVATDREGYFQFGDLRAGERVDLQVTHPDYVDAHLVEIEPPTDEPVQVVLQRGARLTGVVVDGSGRPIGEAHVRASSESDVATGGLGLPRRTGFGGKVDADGRFAFDRIPPGRLEIQVHAPGFSEWQGAETAAAGDEVGPLRIQLERGVLLTGVVRGSDGRPAAGADVEIAPESIEPPQAVRSYGVGSDPSGRYRIDRVQPGRVTISATHRELGFASETAELVSGENRIDLTLSLRGTLSGRVVDPEGRPVARAWVRCQVGEAPAESTTSTSTPEDGAFLFSVPPGPVRLAAMAPGYGLTEYSQVLTMTERPISGIEIRLDRGAEIVGRLIGVERDRLASVAVAAEPIPPSGRTLTGGVEFEGRYRIPGVSPGEWQVSATARGRRAQGRVEVAEGARRVDLDLEFTEGLTLSGRVLLNGEPVAGARVNLVRPDGGAAAGSGTTAYDGSFRLEGLEAGSYVLFLSGGRAGSQTRRLELVSDEELLIDLVGFRVAGRVVRAADGAPIPRAHLELTRDDADGRPPWEVSQRSMTTSDALGRFVFRSIEPGSYRLNAIAERYGMARTALSILGADVEGLEIPIEAGDELILAPRLWNGATPATLHVFLLDGAGRPLQGGEGTPDAAGTVRIAGLPPGTWEAVAFAPGAAAVPLTVTVPGPELPLVMPPATELRVSVPALAAGDGFGRVRIFAADGTPVPAMAGGESIVRNGRGALDKLPPGHWMVEVTASDGRRWTGAATTGADAPAELVLE